MAIEVGRNAKDFDCQTCLEKHCDEEGKIAGSKGPGEYPPWELDGVDYFICPLPQISDLSRYFLSLHTHYSHRLMPLGGGLLNQPNAYLRAMEIIEGKP